MSHFLRHSALDTGSFCLHDVAGVALSVFPADSHSPEGSMLRKREMTINGTIHDLKSPLNSVITDDGVVETDSTRQRDQGDA